MSPRKVFKDGESLTELIKEFLLDKTDQLCLEIKTRLMQSRRKNIALSQENERLLKENKNCLERIHEQDNRIESLLIEIRQNEYGSGDREIADFADKLNQVNAKKKIICDENERLKTELNLLKHQKMRDDQEYKDTIEGLKEMVSSYENSDLSNEHDKQLLGYKEEIEKRNSVIQTLKEAQEKFIGQFQLLQNSVGKSFIVKDGHEVHEQSDKSTEGIKLPNKLSSDTVTTEEAPQIPPSPP